MVEFSEGQVRGWRTRPLPQGSTGDELLVDPRRLRLFPASVPSGDGIARSGYVPGPWGPIGTFLECTPHDRAIPMSVTIASEWPFTPHGLASPLTKQMAEWLKLQLYVQDWWEALGSPPFVVVEQGERPDFRVRTLQGDKGLELSRLTSGERRHAQNLLSYVRRSIRESPQAYSHLRGHVVTIWFTSADVPGRGLPPARQAGATRDLMLRHLRALVPEGVASHAQDVPGLNGAGTNLLLLEGHTPGTDFYSACGFEVTLAYSTEHRASDVWDEIGRLSTQHDYEGVDRLLITVGAPAAPHAEVSAAEYLLWGVAGQSPGWPDAPNLTHIGSVDVHDWWLGSVTRIYPEWEVLVSPRRSGPVFPIRKSGGGDEPTIGWQVLPIRMN